MLDLILGPMFSGKTTELHRRMKRDILAGRKIQYVRSALDTRTFLTHDNIGYDIVSEKIVNLENLQLKSKYIYIDEGNFFPDIDEWVFNHCSDYNITIALLNGTSDGKSFEHGTRLINYANNITYLTAICSECGADASMSIFYGKKDNELLVTDDNYGVLCVKCWNLARRK